MVATVSSGDMITPPAVEQVVQNHGDGDAAATNMESLDVKGQKLSSNFTWKNVTYGVGKGNKAKQILADISGSLSSGEVCALMGPSGAGKTSLLNVLAGRIRSKGAGQRVEGSMLLDGNPISGSSLRKRIAYVMQQDLLTPTQTPREALLFSARLRLPSSVSDTAKKELVEKVLSDLGLMKCADTYIGNELIRGISGGEKKRTCVGIELVVKPKLIFLDEPTSGLDSYAAHSVIAKLRELAAHEGCNVLCTIHQPSSEVFHSFNKVMFLRDGQRFFFGTVPQLSEQWVKVGRGCPSEYNLADHTMFILQTETDEELAGLQTKLNLEDPKGIEDVAKHSKLSVVMAEGKPAGFCTQLLALTKREAQGVWRDKPGMIASIIVPTVLNLFFAAIFAGVGDVKSDNYDPMSHFGGLTQVAIGGMFGAAQPLLLRFPLDRGIFLREYATQTYGAGAYFISKSMVELPQSFLNAVIVWTCTYFIMGLHGNFMWYVLTFWAVGIAAASTALLVGSIAANPEVAQQAAPAVFVPQLLFAGFFIKSDQIPVFLRWAQYTCSLKYGMNLYILNEFGESTREDWPIGAQSAASAFIDSNDIDKDNPWIYILILVCIIVVVRMLSVAALAKRSSSFF
eukprot:TRINITY_DN109599_c0_g1_i1.p1 TRINITY_DN109599_c0_g1~~TRINITY_DN109599_c0_g1_i1.p1  ORF type:complete len:625 (+),score=149.82 TRINITY_DN109599_c0_g1_i1:59-1933(+)